MIEITSKGSFGNTEKFLTKILRGDIFANLDSYGQEGVNALARATPKDTGLTSQCWEYRIIRDRRRPGIEWFNTNRSDGVPIVVLIQYGHATRNGGYVHGRDFINPAIRPIFDKIADEVWKRVIG